MSEKNSISLSETDTAHSEIGTVITIDQFHQAMNDAATEAIGYKKSTKS